MSNRLAGTRVLLPALAKFDGRRFVPWIALVTALCASSVLAYPRVFPTQQDRLGLAAAVGSNPALSIIFGRPGDLLTADGFTAWRSLALGGFMAALAAVFTVTRATRGQEDSGQAELLASGVMGRGTRLVSAVLLALAGSVLLGGISGVVTGLCGGSWEDSLLLGATFTASGWMFAGVAAAAAQLAPDARTANSLAVSVLGVLFLLRGVLEALAAPEWTTWLNPMSWISQTAPAEADNWWPLLPAAVLALLLVGAAFALSARRDFGQGALAPRPGPVDGGLRGPWSLALRLNRAAAFTWVIAFLVLGVVFGYLSTSVEDLLGTNQGAQQLLAGGAASSSELTRSFIKTILSLVGIIAAVTGVQLMLRVRTEELDRRLEPLLAAPLGRGTYYASNAVPALLLPALLTLVSGTVIAAIAAALGTGVSFGSSFLQALLTIPAVWTAAAVGVAVVGVRPRFSIAAWVGVLLSFALTLLGPTLRLSDLVLGLSPFWHVPTVTSGVPDLSGLLWGSAVTVVLVLAGFAGFRRRDIDA
ncbi:ABC transporter permease [Arthrobacter sp. zg-Y20]|uniref:ABC transporter permease n=1 Tax=unclassified Arthrobacter TaxID=235627 RepID=UPI001D150104|nr:MULTISPECIES: ABC transporter permease [unclassified Arthrobacter]MCC3277387.1 ABC transporter permease [Arthrobacter sp. zg-Y20]MDK1317547.1 ABC transporter permease [Arthrobacter sp. zg.Y20]WIB06956.1 ABC transporter permease [Arthrobacter sp. zg-Y20]